MSHQTPRDTITTNYRAIKQVIDWLLPTASFARMKVRKGAHWKPRVLAVTALLWAYSGWNTLTRNQSVTGLS